MKNDRINKDLEIYQSNEDLKADAFARKSEVLLFLIM